ncbi:MAG: hypothetical protein RL748_2853 [Pseudomonadota bacterium]|jgi:hypothetical protein
MLIKTALLLLLSCVMHYASAQNSGFKFPSEPIADANEEPASNTALTPTCRAKLKQQKIMVLLAESRNGIISAKQSSYASAVNIINDKLKALGLKTYTQEQIRAQVAQAEIDAYFKNDPDAALSASKRMAANYVLRGLIEMTAGRNAMVNVNQVNVNMEFTLSGSDGRIISQTGASNASFAGNDVSGMARILVKENADEVVTKLYNDYCAKAGKR